MTAAEPKLERVLVRQIRELEPAVAEALDFLDCDFAGRRVWIKPNLLAPHPPERSVTTDPELVRDCVRGLRARGARTVVVGDNPGGGFTGPMLDFIAPTGIVAASEGCFVDVGAETAILPLRSRYVPQVAVSRTLLDSDLILNLPVFKTHALTIITGSIKNLFGIIPGRQKTRLHGKARNADQFAELMVDIYAAVPVPVLTIVDGQRGMDGQSGPSSGRVRAFGRLIAGRNPVAVDAVLALLAGARPERVPMLRIAAERGLGPIQREQLDIQGEFEPIHGFRLPTTGIAHAATFVSGNLFSALDSRPMLRARLCTECRRCADSCPVDAIRLTPIPEIDYPTCVSCFCCVEVCPSRALVVSRGLRGLWNRLTGR